MPTTSANIEMVFLGLEGASNFKLFGVTAEREVIEIFDPSTLNGIEYIDGPFGPEASLYRYGSAGLGHTNFGVIDGDLYFTSLQTKYRQGEDVNHNLTHTYAGMDVIINRLTDKGVVEKVASLPDQSTIGSAGSQYWPSAVAFNGQYVIPLIEDSGIGRLGIENGEIWGINAEGYVTQISDLARDGANPDVGIGRLGEELYYIADQQTPLDTLNDELWRLTALGTNELVFHDPVGDVTELEVFANSVWFLVEYFPISGVFEPGLHRIDHSGSVSEIDLSVVGGFSYGYGDLKLIDGRLFFSDTYGGLFEVSEEGNLTRLVNEGELYEVRDFTIFDERLFVSGAGGPDYSHTLYEIFPDGTAFKIPGVPEELYSLEAKILTPIGDTLYLLGADAIDDGFGGVEQINDHIIAMDVDLNFTRLTGPSTDNPEIRASGDLYAFSAELPNIVEASVGDRELIGTDVRDLLISAPGVDRVVAGDGDDTIRGHDGSETLNGGSGDDHILGGISNDDFRDVIYAGEGNDSVDAGAGNDLVYGQNGNDTIAGGFGVDELQGQEGNDVITGSAFSDLVYGGAGDDFVNGGFGHDRINGGTGADKFFHVGVEGHGSDWVQDYNAAEGDVLLFGDASGTPEDLQVNFAHTENAEGERSGDDGVMEAFVIYRPSGQIIWALVDGEGQSSINLQIGGDVFDLLR